MKQVIAWQSDDGSLHLDDREAFEADMKYWTAPLKQLPPSGRGETGQPQVPDNAGDSSGFTPTEPLPAASK